MLGLVVVAFAALAMTGAGTAATPSPMALLRRYVLVRVTAGAPSWMGFPGAWGEDQLVFFPQATFTTGAGPTRPAFKKVWKYRSACRSDGRRADVEGT